MVRGVPSDQLVQSDEQPRDGLEGGMVRGGDEEIRDQPEGWYGGGNKRRGINQPRSSTVVWYDDIIDDTIYVDQPKDGLMGGM